jgi:cytochrome bd ubiquinol oxidase subunit II
MVNMPDANGVVTPLMQTVERSPSGWFANYGAHPLLWLAPLAGLAGAAIAMLCAAARRPGAGIVASGLAIAGTILAAGIALFPFVMPSSSQPNASLTLWNATSSHWTLQVMFWAVILFLPVVLAYTTWVYRKLRGKVTLESVRGEAGKSAY